MKDLPRLGGVWTFTWFFEPLGLPLGLFTVFDSSDDDITLLLLSSSYALLTSFDTIGFKSESSFASIFSKPSSSNTLTFGLVMSFLAW